MVLIRELVPADAVRALQAEFDLSERQARRYVNVALEQPDGVAVPERTAVFTVRLAPSLIGGLRERAGATGQTLSAVTAEAVRGYLAGAGAAGRWPGELRSSSSATGSPTRGWRRRTRRWRPNGGV